jgi:K+-sensing histidine kinase KdpD
MGVNAPSRPSQRTDSITRPNLSLVPSERVGHLAVAQPSEQSARKAVMACLTARGSGNSELLRKAAAAAARENDGEFYAVLVDSRRTRFGRAQVRALIDDAILSSYLGAETVSLDSSDVVGELIRFARQARVGRVFVSRTRPAPFFRLFGRTVYSDLLSRAEGFRVDVVGI